jgi:hypothetical protein
MPLTSWLSSFSRSPFFECDDAWPDIISDGVSGIVGCLVLEDHNRSDRSTGFVKFQLHAVKPFIGLADVRHARERGRRLLMCGDP